MRFYQTLSPQRLHFWLRTQWNPWLPVGHMTSKMLVSAVWSQKSAVLKEMWAITRALFILERILAKKFHFQLPFSLECPAIHEQWRQMWVTAHLIRSPLLQVTFWYSSVQAFLETNEMLFCIEHNWHSIMVFFQKYTCWSYYIPSYSRIYWAFHRLQFRWLRMENLGKLNTLALISDPQISFNNTIMQSNIYTCPFLIGHFLPKDIMAISVILIETACHR